MNDVLPVTTRSLDATTRSANDKALVEALTDIVSELRHRQLADRAEADRGNLRGGTDRLARTLADHLLYTEETLFPALREVQPAAVGAIDGMERTHWPLRESARDLTARMKSGDPSESHRMARSFLAAVMDHVTAETAALGGIFRTLEEQQSRQLGRALTGRP